MENVICWEENKGTYLGILSEFSEKETKERAEQVRNIFEKYFSRRHCRSDTFPRVFLFMKWVWKKKK